MNRYFTAEADAFIASKVLEYNRAPTEEQKKVLEALIRERTGILLYLIPQRNLYIKDEDLSGFYLDIVKDMDRIISSFEISGISYIAYLTQICRYRCMRYVRKKEKNEQTELALMRSDPSIYEYGSMYETIRPYHSSRVPRRPRTLREAVVCIMERKGRMSTGNEEENALASYLETPADRRRFLEYLLYLPQVEDAAFIAGVSRVLRVDLSIISRFYELRRSELSANDEAIESAEAIAARYWKMIANLRHAITKEADEEKLKQLTEAKERAERIYRKRLGIIKYAKRGMSHSRIAIVLGIPRTTVTNDISKVKQLLYRISHGMDY